LHDLREAAAADGARSVASAEPTGELVEANA
jgi:hypothetical protein